MPPAHDPDPAVFSQLAHDPRLHAPFRLLLHAGSTRFSPGFPRSLGRVRAECSPGRAAFILRGPTGAGPVLLLVPWAHVSSLSERMLGADARFDAPLPKTAPLAAELGCVAYLVARVLAATAAGYQLEDAHADAGATVAASGDDWLVWPLGLHTDLGSLGCHVVAARGLLPQFSIVLRLVIDDESPLAEEALAPGELVLSDVSGLTLLASGLSGRVVARTPELDVEAVLTLDHGYASLDVVRPRRAPEHELVLAERTLTGEALCALAEGALAWCIDGSAQAAYWRNGEPHAYGTLSMLRGSLGLRVTERA